jgi:parallel beta-helix repeat protein
MQVTLSLFAGAGAQFLDNNGSILSGGLVYTYSAGTTTPLATYTNNLGNTAHSNPIVLDSAGRIPGGELWLTSGLGYKFVTKDANNVLIGTYDNVPSSSQPPVSNDASSIYYEQGYVATAGTFIVGITYLITYVGSTNFQAIGASANQVGTYFTATGVGSGTGMAQVSRTVQNKLQEFVSVKDFGAKGDGSHDDTSAIQAAIDSVNVAGGGSVFIPATSSYYLISSPIYLYSNITLFGEGYSSKIYSINNSGTGGILTYPTGQSSYPANYLTNIHIKNLSVISNVTYTGGSGTGYNNREAIFLSHCQYSSIEGCFIQGWSGGGATFNDSSYCLISNNYVDSTAQGVVIFGTHGGSSHCVVSNNIITNTGVYVGIQIENGGDFANPVLYTVVSNNTIYNSYNSGIGNVLARYTTITGNTINLTGLITDGQLSQPPWGTPSSPAEAPSSRSGIVCFGGLGASITGNTVSNSKSYGIVVQGGDYCTVNSNTTNNSTTGDFLATTSNTGGITGLNLGSNAFSQNIVSTAGNIYCAGQTPGFTFLNNSSVYFPSPSTTLNYYQKSTFTPVVQGQTTAGTCTYALQAGTYVRVGALCTFSIQVQWSGHTGTGNINISGLPFVPDGAIQGQPISWTISSIPIGAGYIPQFWVNGFGSSIILSSLLNQASGTDTGFPLPASGSMRLQGSYIIG